MATLAELLKSLGIEGMPAWMQNIDLPFDPMTHQSEMIQRYAVYDTYLDASDVGCGKTYPAQVHAIVMAALGNRVFFSMPPKLLEQAFDEFMIFFPGILNHLKIEFIGNTPKKKERQLEQWRRFGWPDILLGSFDSFRAMNSNKARVVVPSNQVYLMNEDGSLERTEGKEQPVDTKLYTKDGRPIFRSRAKNKIKGVRPWVFRADNLMQLQLVRAGYNVFFFDEAHRELCNPGNQSHEALRASSKRLKGEIAVYLMTATPIPTEVQNVYGIIKLINPTAYSDRAQFDRAHCIYNPDSDFAQIIGYKNYDQINRALYARGRRVEQRDVLKELKDPLVREIKVKLTGEHKKLYDRILSDRIALIGDQVLTVENDQQLRQTALKIIAAPEQFDENRSTKLREQNVLRDACDDYVEQVVKEGGRKIILVSYFQSVVKALKEHYAEYNPAMINGSTTNSGAQVKKFKEDPTCKVFVIQWKSGGAGLNLQSVCSDIAFYEMPTSPSDARQVIGRVQRKGQQNQIQACFFRVTGTLADKNFRRLLKNDKQNNEVIQDKHDVLYKSFGVSKAG